MKKPKLHDIPGHQRIQRATNIDTERLACLVGPGLGVGVDFAHHYHYRIVTQWPVVIS